MTHPLFLTLAASLFTADGMRALGFKEESITARRQREAAEVRRMMRRKKPYKGKIGTSQPDDREDKYLHSAARRRRQADRSQADGGSA